MSDKKNKSLKPGWREVKFGDVVQLSKSRSQDPLADGIERYVGLEHLEPGDLRIRSWGNVADGVTFTSVFQPGQVLFGKRRAYQRKVAVADFSGVCSGDIYVLESKDSKILLPELLPFICQTDAFFDHAVGTSAGSLSPRTNWQSLSEYVLLLPPIQEQEAVLTKLQAAESLTSSLRSAVEDLSRLRDALSISRFHSGPLTESTALGTLAQGGLLTLQTGPFGTVLKASAYRESGVPIVNPVNISEGGIELEGIALVGEEDCSRLGKYRIEAGDILIGRKRHMSKLVLATEQHSGFIVGSDCIRFRLDRSCIDSRFIFFQLRSRKTQHWLQSQAGGNGTVMPGMNEKLLSQLAVRVPELELQQAIAAEFLEIDATERVLLARIDRLREVFARLNESWQARC